MKTVGNASKNYQYRFTVFKLASKLCDVQIFFKLLNSNVWRLLDFLDLSICWKVFWICTDTTVINIFVKHNFEMFITSTPTLATKPTSSTTRALHSCNFRMYRLQPNDWLRHGLPYNFTFKFLKAVCSQCILALYLSWVNNFVQQNTASTT